MGAAACPPLLRFWPVPHCSPLVYKIKPIPSPPLPQLSSFLLEFLILSLQSLSNGFYPFSEREAVYWLLL